MNPADHEYWILVLVATIIGGLIGWAVEMILQWRDEQ